jgi:hypothetical protein
MIRNVERWQKWEAEQMRGAVDFPRNQRMFEAMYQHARRLNPAALSRFPEDLEFKIRLAGALNVRAPA